MFRCAICVCYQRLHQGPDEQLVAVSVRKSPVAGTLFSRCARTYESDSREVASGTLRTTRYVYGDVDSGGRC